MTCGLLLPHAYKKLVAEDIEWLKRNTPQVLEQHHIIEILKQSAGEYEARGRLEQIHSAVKLSDKTIEGG